MDDEIIELENFIKDAKYKEQLINSADYYPWVKFQLRKLNKLEIKLKERMQIPLNSLIKFEKIENGHYFSAYFWDSHLQKTKKKHIGKRLPSFE